MSIAAIGPVPFVNSTSLMDTTDPQAHSPLQDSIQKTNAQLYSDVSSSGSAVLAVQAFMAFQPDVQPIASLHPTEDNPDALPLEVSTDLADSATEWSGSIVDVYA